MTHTIGTPSALSCSAAFWGIIEPLITKSGFRARIFSILRLEMPPTLSIFATSAGYWQKQVAASESEHYLGDGRGEGDNPQGFGRNGDVVAVIVGKLIPLGLW